MSGRPAANLRALLLAAALALTLAGCGGGTTAQNPADAKLEKPTKVFVAPLDTAPDLPPVDPALAARLRRDLPGLTDDAAQIEALRRFDIAVVEALVSTLRAGGMEAAPGGGERLMASDVGLMISGKLRADAGADPSGRARRAGAPRVAADFTLIYYANTQVSRPVLSFATEAQPVGAPSPARPPAGAGGTRLSPEVDASARQIGRAAGERVLGFAAEKGWIKAPAVAATRR